MPSYLEAYKNAIDEEKKSMTENELAEFEKKIVNEREIIEEHEKTMVRHDESEFIMDERGIDESEEDHKYPEADDPEDLLKQTNDFMGSLGKNACDCEQADPYSVVVKESEIKTERIDVRPVLVRGYCPKCGKEIISMCPPMYNPYTLEKRNIHKCGSCGWTGNLEHSYPRIVFIDAQNNEYDAYTK